MTDDQQHFPDEGMTSFDTEGDVRGGETGSPDDGAPSADAEGSVDDPLAAAQAAVEGLTLDLKRLQAEYVNYKRRVDRDRELVLENAKFSVLSALMPVLDDLDRAREHGELEGGFKAVADQLDRAVTSMGLTRFGAPGDPFDPELHDALSHLGTSPDVTVVTCRHVVKSGYRFGDRVVRAAQVVVVDPEEATTEPEAEDTDVPAE